MVDRCNEWTPLTPFVQYVRQCIVVKKITISMSSSGDTTHEMVHVRSDIHGEIYTRLAKIQSCHPI